MKNAKLLITGIILLFVSSIFAEDITLYNVTPCILLPWVVYISIVLEPRTALTYTFFVSLAHDLLNPQLLGFTTVLFILLSHFIYRYNASFNKDKYTTIMFSMLVINTAFYLVQWLYFVFSSPEPFYLLGKVAFTIVYNSFLSCIIIFVIFLIDKLRLYVGD